MNPTDPRIELNKLSAKVDILLAERDRLIAEVAELRGQVSPEPPATPAFKVGDRVKVVGPIDETRAGYVRQLTERVGLTGWLVGIRGAEYQVQAGGQTWWYPKENIALAPDEAGEKPTEDDPFDSRVTPPPKSTRKMKMMSVEDYERLVSEQPPMSRERFRQEAAIAAMGATLSNPELLSTVATVAREEGVSNVAMVSSSAVEHANSLADAVFG